MTSYRAEIDGLRAVAVLAVLSSHAGVPGLSGGFVGVDVFFVISGYLICSLLLKELRDGRLSLPRFVERRVRRLLPALLLVLLCCWPAAWVILVPQDFVAFSKSVLATLGLSSNVYFWRSTGYFGLEGELQPLLHVWSLSVEEQFYLIFPAALALAWRFRSGTQTTRCLFIAMLLSLGLAAWGSEAHPVAAFYLLPTRAWELLAGAALAQLEHKGNWSPSQRCRQWGSALGLALILAAITGFDRYVRTPGPWALLPVAGSLLIIACASPETWVARALSTPPMVWVGLISYSAYLWHQPLFAFARQWSDRPPSAWHLALLIALSLGLAHLTWRWVERPWRNPDVVGRRTLLFGVGWAACTLGAFSAATWQTQGFEQRFTPAQRSVLAYLNYPFALPYLEGKCFVSARHLRDDAGSAFTACWDAQARAHLAVWGDSHAAALASGLRTRSPGLAQFTTGGCPPLTQVNQRMFPECNGANAAALQQLAHLQPRHLLMHANWLNYPGIDVKAELDRTLIELQRRLPQTTVVLVGMAPQWYPSLPVQLVRQHQALVDGARMPMPQHPSLARLDDRLFAVARRHGVLTHSLLDALCEGDTCRAVTTWKGLAAPVAWDYGHMTEAGAAWVAPGVMARLSSASTRSMPSMPSMPSASAPR